MRVCMYVCMRAAFVFMEERCSVGVISIYLLRVLLIGHICIHLPILYFLYS